MYRAKKAHWLGWLNATILAGVGLLCLVSLGEAGPLLPFAGNTNYSYPGPGAPLDGTLNVVVYQRDENPADLTDVFGTGFAGFDLNFSDPAGLNTNSNYLYLYQLVNNGKQSQYVSSVGLTLGTDVTSYGIFNNVGFTDGEGLIRSTNSMGEDGNTFEVNATVNNSDIDPQPGIADLNLTPGAPIFKAPTFVEFFPETNSSTLRAVWLTSTAAVQINEVSTLFGFTSNSAPDLAYFSAQFGQAANAQTYGPGIREGGDGGGGTNPTPEPSTLVLSCLGLVGLGAGAWRRRQQSKQQPMA